MFLFNGPACSSLCIFSIEDLVGPYNLILLNWFLYSATRKFFIELSLFATDPRKTSNLVCLTGYLLAPFLSNARVFPPLLVQRKDCGSVSLTPLTVATTCFLDFLPRPIFICLGLNKVAGSGTSPNHRNPGLSGEALLFGNLDTARLLRSLDLTFKSFANSRLVKVKLLLNALRSACLALRFSKAVCLVNMFLNCVNKFAINKTD